VYQRSSAFPFPHEPRPEGLFDLLQPFFQIADF
jgi:hypothetical protein